MQIVLQPPKKPSCLEAIVGVSQTQNAPEFLFQNIIKVCFQGGGAMENESEGQRYNNIF